MAKANRLKGVLEPINIGREETLRIMERLSAGTHLVSSAEYLARPGNTEAGSVGDWQVVRDRFRLLPAWQRRLFDVVSRPPVTRALHAGRIVASCVLLLPTGNRLRATANAFLTASSALLYPRHNFGTDGSDQVSMQTSAVALSARLTSSKCIQDAAIWYLALQDALSYAVSGWVKLFGTSWRSGSAVAGVMRTVTYGNKHVWRVATAYPKLGRIAAHGMLAFEGLFPVVLFARGRLTRPLIVTAIGFHTFVAGSMGLGRFLTAFGSMLPAIAYVTNRREKSNAVPAVAAMALGGAMIGGLVASTLRGRRIQRLVNHRHEFSTQAGNRLVYEWTGGRSGDPVLVLEHGMLSTPQHFAWLVNQLPDGVDVLTYWRAGYGPSTSVTGERSVEQAAHDLADLIRDLPTHVGSIFLGGHSLGGLVARRAAEISERGVAGIVYIDSSHPGQLAISDQQRRGAAGLRQALIGVPTSLRLGWGWLLRRPEWVKALPDHVQRSVLDQYRDARMWSAGAREWASADQMFRKPENAELASVPVPALVITAEMTLRADDSQERLHQDLLDSHHGLTERLVIREADHDSILTNRSHAAAAAYAIHDFIRQVVRA